MYGYKVCMGVERGFCEGGREKSCPLTRGSINSLSTVLLRRRCHFHWQCRTHAKKYVTIIYFVWHLCCYIKSSMFSYLHCMLMGGSSASFWGSVKLIRNKNNQPVNQFSLIYYLYFSQKYVFMASFIQLLYKDLGLLTIEEPNTLIVLLPFFLILCTCHVIDPYKLSQTYE